MKKQDTSKRVWVVLLTASLLLNAYTLLHKRNKSNEVLASGLSQKLRWADVTDERKDQLKRLDGLYYSTLRAEISSWAEKLLLPKEALARKISVDELVKAEVLDKVRVSEQEVRMRYARSPRADNTAYPQVLTQIRNEIAGARQRVLRADFLRSLMRKYGVKVHLKPPAGFEDDQLLATQFPEYVPPPGGDGLNMGRVVGPPSKGRPQAPVVIELFSEYMCPFARNFDETLKQLMAKYPEDVRLVYRHFPLDFHRGAEVMAEAAVCAQEQGKFWEYHDAMVAAGGKLEKEALVKAAADLKLDTAAFQGCMDSGRNRARVAADMNVGRMAGVSGTPSYLINGRYGSGSAPLDQLSLLVEWHLNPQGRYPGAKEIPAAAAKSRPAPSFDPNKVYDLPADWLKRGPSRGPENAPITLVEMLDYHCPFCKKGDAIVTELMDKYPGKIRVISKHLPLDMHPNAKKAGAAVACAFEQGKGWEFRKEIFGASWNKQTADDLKAAAKAAGLKTQAFDACFDSGKGLETVEADLKVASSLNAVGTPSFFINGIYIRGAQPIENFSKVIDDILQKKADKK